VGQSNGNLGLYAVLDGHGGAETVDFIRRQLPNILGSEISSSKNDISNAVHQSMKRVDAELIKKGMGRQQGSTAVLAFIDVAQGTMHTADLGDSYIVVAEEIAQKPGEFNVRRLSKAQKPEQESEKRRIEAAGGHVLNEYGAHRVEGSVAMSRALGDLDFKAETKKDNEGLTRKMTSKLGQKDGPFTDGAEETNGDMISNKPHFQSMTLTSSKRSVVLLASDGLGEEKDAKTAMAWACNQWKEGWSAFDIADALTKRSSKKMTSDNSTAVVLFIERCGT